MLLSFSKSAKHGDRSRPINWNSDDDPRVVKKRWNTFSGEYSEAQIQKIVSSDIRAQLIKAIWNSCENRTSSLLEEKTIYQKNMVVAESTSVG